MMVLDTPPNPLKTNFLCDLFKEKNKQSQLNNPHLLSFISFPWELGPPSKHTVGYDWIAKKQSHILN
jgi:hypothetical protein